ncbi:hypothetical protein HY967_03250 [Candidatus Jorgensenbacteria bacterium]|nr:hypothetical protein [Candidatus Jorgensenbacteria bacterium]
MNKISAEFLLAVVFAIIFPNFVRGQDTTRGGSMSDGMYEALDVAQNIDSLFFGTRPSSHELTHNALRMMVESLHDPYSKLRTPEASAIAEKEEPTFLSRMINDSVVYFAFKDFSVIDGLSFDTAMHNVMLRVRDPRFIIDLRDNGGGRIPIAERIAAYWLDTNKIFYWEESRRGRNPKRVTTVHEMMVLAGRTVILVDGGSASAAEALAGAIQDYDMGILLGRPTYGKDLVQTTVTLRSKCRLTLTSARWYTPLMRDVGGCGLVPDFLVEDTGDDLEDDLYIKKAMEILTSR